MNERIFIIALSILSLGTGCATRPSEPAAARRSAYERLLGFVKPGMTRRQLYALLPPRRTPTAEPPSQFALIGVWIYKHHTETHKLDRDFSLYVQYRLANGSEYRFGASSAPKRVPSKQNPDDELATRPTLLGPAVPHRTTVIELSLGEYDDMTVPESRPTKIR